MDERLARNISKIRSLDELFQLEANARDRRALSTEMSAAIKARSGELGRKLLAERTGIDVSDLSPAEEKVVFAISVYAALKRREGANANRTLKQIKEHGLLGAAERAVARSKPTMGFEALAERDHLELSYEQIVVDHPGEFSPRALWFSRRALNLPNESEKPPATAVTPVQFRTEVLLRWVRERISGNGGLLTGYTNNEAATSLGMENMHQYGRVFGNIQSRIDYACYLRGLPPLGLMADEPFERAWQREGRSWEFPVAKMQAATQARRWREEDIDAILTETERLPGQAHLIWRDELKKNEDRVRQWAFRLSNDVTLTNFIRPETDSTAPSRRNPIWLQDELILALELYLRHRTALPGKESVVVAELSEFLGELSRAHGNTNAATYRNANGVYMKMMNFRRFDPAYLAEGKVGLTRGNRADEVVWNEFSKDPIALAAAVERIRKSLNVGPQITTSISPLNEPHYWVFVCNPKKWAIDRFLDRRIVLDSWGIRKSDRERFAPGQLGVVRVGVDRRSNVERNGAPPLEAGIYALCIVESRAFDGNGANDEFWEEGQAREAGWPTVQLRYLQTYLNQPLTVASLRASSPNVSPLLLNGFQAASFPISATDFHTVLTQLGERLENSALVTESPPAHFDQLAALERKYCDASPEVKKRVSYTIERGHVGAEVKRANGFRCQLCEALGDNPIGFKKSNGEPYVEAHHVMPVSSKAVGSLAASNIITLCANHHREVHYGSIEIINRSDSFHISYAGKTLILSRCVVPGTKLTPASAAGITSNEQNV